MHLRKGFRLLLILCSGLAVSLEACCSKSGKEGGWSTTNTGVQASKKTVEISRVGLAKGENYLGGEVYYVEGTLTNKGDRAIFRINLAFVFKDTMDQAVLKETRKAIEYKVGKGLEPQKSIRFQVAFDHLPKDWNHVIPEVEVNDVVLR